MTESHPAFHGHRTVMVTTDLVCMWRHKMGLHESLQGEILCHPVTWCRYVSYSSNSIRPTGSQNCKCFLVRGILCFWDRK